METILIVGLGNPGKEYQNTRHNAGFITADAFAAAHHIDIDNAWQGGKAVYGKGSINGTAVYILKPMTYMNLSGEAVSPFAHFYKIPPQNIVVIFDDMDLPLGSVRLRKSGSAGGQNGMKSVITQLGTQNIPRLRLGIGPRPSYFQGKDFVLSKFTAQEQPALKTALETACIALEDIITQGIDKAMNKCNAK